MEFRSLKSLTLLLPFKTDLRSGPHDHHAEKRALLMKDGGSVTTRTSIILFTCIKFDTFSPVSWGIFSTLYS